MSYDALTIDTQPVYAANGRLDEGLLDEMRQYNNGLVKVVLSEITIREIRKFLIEKARKPISDLVMAIRVGGQNGQLSSEQQSALDILKDGMASPEDHVKKQLTDFIKLTGAEVIGIERTSLKDVMDRYFRGAPPFAGKGKKHEFPDAVALLSLEAWAIENGKRILAVSDDKDWSAFAEQSDHIDVIDDLGKAMARLSELADEAEPKAQEILRRIKVSSSEESKRFEQGLADAVESETPYLEFDGPMPGQDEGVTLSLLQYEIDPLADNPPDIDIIRVGTAGFAFRIAINITATVQADIGFYIRDSVDKDYVSMGSASVEQEAEFEAYVLIDVLEVEADDSGTVEFEIESVQLLHAPPSFDVGYIDYSLADDDYDYEPGDWAQVSIKETKSDSS